MLLVTSGDLLAALKPHSPYVLRIHIFLRAII